MDAQDTELDPFRPQSYGMEVLCSGWNPLVATAVEPIGQVYRGLLADLTVSDVEGFLRQFYRWQGS